LKELLEGAASLGAMPSGDRVSSVFANYLIWMACTIAKHRSDSVVALARFEIFEPRINKTTCVSTAADYEADRCIADCIGWPGILIATEASAGSGQHHCG
jgi:hypothetical protein